MKCPCCGAADLIHDTRDMPYTYKGETTVIHAVTADYCPACDEAITDMKETERVMREMQAFNNQVKCPSPVPIPQGIVTGPCFGWTVPRKPQQ